MKQASVSAKHTGTSKNRESLTFLYKLSDRVTGLAKKAEQADKRAEIVILLIWSVIHFVVSAFHERWFDEAVSWRIAQNAPIKDILFTLPHYEGHPPFWHLLLAPFARLGIPYSLSLTIISFVFMGLTVWLLLYKSPFPRIVRWVLPFTYFLMYQYGIITRPYCVMSLAFVLLGLFHSERNTKPLRYVLCLALLCLTSAYGILLAGGICIVWGIEILREKISAKAVPSLLKDNRFLLLGGLLVLALLLVWEFRPYPDTYASAATEETNSFILRILYTLLIAPLDSLITNIFSYDTRLDYLGLSALDMIPGCVLGLVFLALICYFGKKKNTLLYYLIPYGIFAAFSAIVYFSQHHIGICFLYLMFWGMLTVTAKENRSIAENTVSATVNSAAVLFGCVAAVISAAAGFTACIHDIYQDYAGGKDALAFIQEHDLGTYHVATEWTVLLDDSDETESMPEMLKASPDFSLYAEEIGAYLRTDIFDYTFLTPPEHSYIIHRYLTDEEYEKYRAQMAQMPIPDVLIGNNDLHLSSHYFLEPYWGKEAVKNADYKRVYLKTYHRLWKFGACVNDYYDIYVKAEIAEKLNLPVIPDSDIPLL